MPKGENLTPYDVAVIRDLVLWAQDQDADATTRLTMLARRSTGSWLRRRTGSDCG